VPVTYSIDPVRKLIHTICSGPLTLEEVVDHFRALTVDPTCVGDLDVLLDVDRAERFPDVSELGSVVTEVAKVSHKVRFGLCAIIASNVTMFGMMRMFEVLAGRYFRAVRVFRKAPQAEEWLNSHHLKA